MSKFGELIDDKLPLLLVFYNAEDNISDSMHPILKDVAAAMGDKGKVIKIDTEKKYVLTYIKKCLTKLIFILQVIQLNFYLD